LARLTHSSGSPYEPVIGFSRAVRVGDRICVSGTGPVGADQADPATQTRRCLEIIREAIEALGGRMEDVVRTRMYLVNPADWEEIGRVHGEVFADIRPAATMIVVQSFLDPRWRVEIEAETYSASNPD
jgi:enamine deaminase RidA (YjgF/YER057c/UK114 family)